MVNFETLPKVLFKPREFYESMEEVAWKEGVLIMVLSLLLSLIIYSIFANMLGTSVILFNFGLGYELSAVSLLFGFSQVFVLFFAGSWIANISASFLGGRGNLSELLGMFGYSEFLAVPKSFVSIFSLLILFSKVSSIETAGGFEQFFSSFIWVIVALSMIFLIWEIWIKGTAVSVEHGISMFRGTTSAFFSVLVVYFIISYISVRGVLL